MPEEPKQPNNTPVNVPNYDPDGDYYEAFEQEERELLKEINSVPRHS